MRGRVDRVAVVIAIGLVVIEIGFVGIGAGGISVGGRGERGAEAKKCARENGDR